jgi:hypothetical protein
MWFLQDIELFCGCGGLSGMAVTNKWKLLQIVVYCHIKCIIFKALTIHCTILQATSQNEVTASIENISN